MSAYPTHAKLHRPARARAVRGIGVVEIMIALTLGLVVIGALGQLYRGSIKSHQVSYTMAQVGESGRLAVDLLSAELRMAGYLSCGGSSARLANTVDGGGHWLYQTDGIEGYEGGVDALPDELDGEVRTNTDLLILRRATIDLERTIIDDDSGNAIIEIGPDHGFKTGEILVASNPNCTQASLFQVTNLHNVNNPEAPNLFDAIEHDPASAIAPGNCSANLFGDFDCSAPSTAEGGSFAPGSVISRFTVAAYYVTAGDPPFLARKRLGISNGEAAIITEELVRNVEDFQILYGRDTVPDGAQIVDDYVTADQVADWSQVISVNFGFLLKSNDGGVRTEATAQAFTLPGRNVSANADRHLRRAFGSVVALRNNLP